MKKLITITIIIVAVILLVLSFTAYAKIDKDINISEHTRYLYIGKVDATMDIVKITDGAVDCYLSTTFVSGNKVNTAISCVKVR